jgi:hypothetical protein
VAHHVTAARCSWFLLEARSRVCSWGLKAGPSPGHGGKIVARRISGTVEEESFDLNQAGHRPVWRGAIANPAWPARRGKASASFSATPLSTDPSRIRRPGTSSQYLDGLLLDFALLSTTSDTSLPFFVAPTRSYRGWRCCPYSEPRVLVCGNECRVVIGGCRANAKNVNFCKHARKLLL